MRVASDCEAEGKEGVEAVEEGEEEGGAEEVGEARLSGNTSAPAVEAAPPDCCVCDLKMMAGAALTVDFEDDEEDRKAEDDDNKVDDTPL